MSDGGRGRASLGVEVWKSSQKWSAQRSAVRSIAWLDGWRGSMGEERAERYKSNSSAPQAKQPWKLIICVAKANKWNDQISNTAPEN